MDIKDLYDKVSNLSLADKKKTLAQLSPEDKKEFDKFNNKQRQAKYLNKLKSNDLDKFEQLKSIKNNNKKKLLQNPDKNIEYKSKNIISVKKFRLNEKIKLDDLKRSHAISIIINAIKSFLAKKKLNYLRQSKLSKDLLKEKRRIYMRNWRAKQKLKLKQLLSSSS